MQSAPLLNVSGDRTLRSPCKFCNDHQNTTDSRCSLGRGIFAVLFRALIHDIPFGSVTLKQLHKSLATVRINQQIARQLHYRV